MPLWLWLKLCTSSHSTNPANLSFSLQEIFFFCIFFLLATRVSVFFKLSSIAFQTEKKAATKNKLKKIATTESTFENGLELMCDIRFSET